MSKKRKPASKQFYHSSGKDFVLVGAKRKLTIDEENELLAVLVNRWECRRLYEYMEQIKQAMESNRIKMPSEDDIKNPSPTFWGRPLLTGSNRAGKSWINDLVVCNKPDDIVKPSNAWIDEIKSLRDSSVYIDEAELRNLPPYRWVTGVDLATRQDDLSIKHSICNPKVIITNKS
nr:MAG TPA: hypothetical protein [Bacteriophage sp.]